MTLRRSPIKRGTTRLAQVSEKRQGRSEEYRQAKEAVWNRDRGQCQAQFVWPEVECWGKKDPHHRAPVGLYPELREDPDNLLVLCRAHHMACHNDDPIRARELGLLL